MKYEEIFQSPSAQEFLNELKHIMLKTQRPANEIILDEVDFCQFLKISKRYAADLRAERKITYSKIGGKLYYRLSDILNLIERYKIKSVEDSIRLFKNNR